MPTIEILRILYSYANEKSESHVTPVWLRLNKAVEKSVKVYGLDASKAKAIPFCGCDINASGYIKSNSKSAIICTLVHV